MQVFSSFKIGNMFGVKDPIPDGLRSRVVYKFALSGSNASYVGETVRHFSTRVKEHLASDRSLKFSDICKILNIVAPGVQQIVSMFWITPLRVFNLNKERAYIYRGWSVQPANHKSQRTTNATSWLAYSLKPNFSALPQNSEERRV